MDSIMVSCLTECAIVTFAKSLFRNEQDKLDALALNADLQPLLTLVKAARNGAVYGAKVRFPHALV